MAEENWDVVSEEAPTMMVFDTIGDQFIGTYSGNVEITPDEDDPDSTFTQGRFRGTDGELYATNLGYDLRTALGKVQPGTLCRITYMKDIDTGQPSPMKSFRVETRNA
jgi:hypothetical protein